MVSNYTSPFTPTLWSSSAKHTLYPGNGKKSPGPQQMLPDCVRSSVKHRSDFDVCLHMFLVSILGNIGIQRRISWCWVFCGHQCKAVRSGRAEELPHVEYPEVLQFIHKARV